MVLIIGLAGQAPYRRSRLSSNVRQHGQATMALATTAEVQMPLQPRLAGQSQQAKRRRSRFTRGASASRSSSQALAVPPCPALEPLLRSVSSLGRLAAAVRACAHRSWGGTPSHQRWLGFAPAARLRSVPKPLGFLASPLACHRCVLSVLPNPSLEPTRTGMALGPRASRSYHPSRGPSATPALAPQLKR